MDGTVLAYVQTIHQCQRVVTDTGRQSAVEQQTRPPVLAA